MGALEHLAGFAKEAEAEQILIRDSAIEGLKKEAENQGMEITDEQALEILKEAGFWEAVTKMRNLPGAPETGLLAKKMYVPGVPYEGSLVANALIGAGKAVVGAGKAAKGVGKGVKTITGLPKTLAHGIVETPRVVKETIQRAVKKGPEQSESVKKILTALGLTGVGAGVVAGGNVARKKLWGDKSITPFGSSGEWGGVLGSRIEKEEEEQEKAANILSAGIPLVTGSKAKDKDWDLKKSLILGTALGALLKIPITKPLAGKATVENILRGGIGGGMLGGVGHGISALFRKKEPGVVE